MKDYGELLVTFLKLGALTFGGGYAMIPVVERELVKKKGWTTMDEVMNYYTIAQVTPGIIAVNLSTFIGYNRKGPLGGILATLSFALPGVTFITIIAVFLTNIMDFPVVQHAFTGIRVAVGALILDTVIKMLKGVFKNWKALAISVIAFALSFFRNVSPALLVVASGLAGLLIFPPAKQNVSGDGGESK
ncbi:MAG: chromate transporter [Treponema sp.]|jgi:chromate transporter|nr:chromate transporter [Treponema sp.]